MDATKELLTASRTTTALNCLRQHYYRYELGLKPVEDADALLFGSAFHKALEARAKGTAFSTLFDVDEIENFTDAKLYGLVGGYYRKWNGEADEIAHMKPEIEFGPDPICGSRTFYGAGKIDGLAGLKDGRVALVEHKTTGEDIADGADYWLRLSFNPQIYKYWIALQDRGIVPDTVIYDVVRKPTIKPGKDETPKDFALRLLDDCTGEAVQARTKAGELRFTATGTPMWARRGADWYFKRRHVAITTAMVDEFKSQVRSVCHILTYVKGEARDMIAKGKDPATAWPRNCNGFVCDQCGYRAVCHGRVTIDPNCPPAGFKIAPPNEELSVAPGPEADGMK